MATSGHDSSLHIELGPWPETSPEQVSEQASETASADSNGSGLGASAGRGEGTVWLDGNVLACGCPRCGMPLAIRVWLMTADCWRCGTSVELTLEQEREARRLLERLEQRQPEPAPVTRAAPKVPDDARPPQPKRPASASSVPPPASPAASAKNKLSPSPHKPKRSAPHQPPAKPVAAPPPSPKTDSPKPPVAPSPAAKTRQVPPPPPAPKRRPAVPHDTFGSTLAAEYRSVNLLKDLPAWLISLVFHMVLILLLGLWTLESEDTPRSLVLSVTVGPQHREGGEPAEEEVNEDEFELPVDKPPENEAEREAIVRAEEDARQLQIDPVEAERNLPKLEQVMADLTSPDPYRRMHAARDPRVRSEVVRQEGGTLLTEAAVARALRWLTRHQNPNGSWSLHAFHRTADCNGACKHAGAAVSDTAGTALVLMALLGTGQTHKAGVYKKNVGRGLQWLLAHQKSDGDLRANSRSNTGMYAHGQATIVLCDAFKLTADEALRSPAQRAVDFICKSQHSAGGWRYTPGQAGDTSVVGWQLMALHSAKAAYLHVPRENALRAGHYLDLAQRDKVGGLYAYMPGQAPTPTMTAEGLLSRMYLGWDRKEKGLDVGIKFLVGKHLPNVRRPNIYYWYYGTQVMHHWGGDAWQQWNAEIRDILVTTQETSGHQAGSWPPNSPHGRQGGRLYMTALAACTLEVYYRYAPLYWQLDLD